MAAFEAGAQAQQGPCKGAPLCNHPLQVRVFMLVVAVVVVVVPSSSEGTHARSACA